MYFYQLSFIVLTYLNAVMAFQTSAYFSQATIVNYMLQDLFGYNSAQLGITWYNSVQLSTTPFNSVLKPN